ncbi:MAG: glycosyl hydrolase family 18 [Actinomycetota bacterium]
MQAALTTEGTPRRRLHLGRLLLVVGLAAGAVVALKGPFHSGTASAGTDTWFSPYVDVTLTPGYPFGDTRFNPANSAVLGFVVASHENPCVASWGGYVTPAAASEGIDLDRRLATLRARGGDAIVSFGGAVNNELAVGCTTPARLTAAYSAIVLRYDANVLDFDIEGTDLADHAAAARRAAAIATIQKSSKTPLKVWLTLPVGTTGLTADGVAQVDAFLSAGVQVAGVNAMTMDFNTLTSTDVESIVVQNAIDATANQVKASFEKVGTSLSGRALWSRIGATVMIGRNDVRTEVFTLQDATDLMAFAKSSGLGRLSLWSLNRDIACGSEVDSGIAQNGCSGVKQDPLAFSSIFAAQSDGAPTADTIAPTDPAASRSKVVVDNPATAPYQIWMSGRGYQGTDKVVWHGNVYQAKWWNQNAQPDTPAMNAWETPWSFIGPVLPTDRPAATTTIPPGTYPDWVPANGYPAGTKIEHHGIAYVTKWYSLGQEPGALVSNPWDTPWAVISADDPSFASTTTIGQRP